MSAIDRRSGAYLQAAIKLPCRVAAVADIALSGLLTIDGVVLVAGDRVLVTAQSPSTENGIYVADTGGWARSADCNGPRDLVQGSIVAVTSGTAYAGSVWQVTTALPVIDSALTWAPMGASALALVSPFMLTVIDDLTALAARTTLGAVGLTGNETVAGNKSFSGTSAFSGPETHSGTEGHTGAETHTGTASFTNLRGNIIPTARLTLTSGTPILTSNVAGSATVYYALYGGNVCPIYDGTGFVLATITELSNVLANSATGKAGPAAAAAAKNYDLFVWDDAGTPRLTRGGAWFSDTARSTATENDLQRTLGIQTNLNAITNGPAAGRGTYVGTVRTDAGAATVSWHVGAVAASGTAATLHVWNAYNRCEIRGLVGDSTDSWSNASGAWRASNASNGNRASWIQGVREDYFVGKHIGSGITTGGNWYVGVGFNSVTAPSGQSSQMLNPGIVTQGQANHTVNALGFNFMQAIELNVAVAATMYGDAGTTVQYSGLFYEGMF